MVRMSILRLAVSVAVVFSIVTAPTCEARPSPLEKLDGVDLADLLDAPLDETFLQRNLQEATPVPTPAQDLSTSSSPTVAVRDLTSMGPTGAPTGDSRGLSSMSPTAAPTAAPTGSDTSGAMGMVQAAASFATAATVLMATAVIA